MLGAVAVNKIEHAIADAVDSRQIQLHQSRFGIECNCTLRQRVGVRCRAIGHAPAHRAGRRTVRMCELLERSEEHTSELQSLMRISYAVFCLKKKINTIIAIS